MSLFFLGLVLGAVAGAVGTLLLLQFVYRKLPDLDTMTPEIRERWGGIGLILAATLGCGVLFMVLDLYRVAFATCSLLLIIFVAARLRGVLVSWIVLAIATFLLVLILPPTARLAVADPRDQVLLAFFVLCGAIGSRLVSGERRD